MKDVCRNVIKDVINVIFFLIVIVVCCRFLYEDVQKVYVYTHGEDIEVTITDKEHLKRNSEELTFVYKGNVQRIEGRKFFFSSIKAGSIVHVRKCENIDLFVLSSDLVFILIGILAYVASILIVFFCVLLPYLQSLRL